MIVKPPSFRHTSEKSDDTLRIVIPSRKSLIESLWTAVWLCLWGLMVVGMAIVVGSMLIGLYSTRNNATLLFAVVFSSLFLAALVSMGIVVIYHCLWQLAGKEVVTVCPVSLTLDSQLFGRKQSEVYLAEHIHDLQVSQPRWEGQQDRIFKKLMRRDGLIAFDYGAKTFRFGLGLEEAEARQIISEIRND